MEELIVNIDGKEYKVKVENLGFGRLRLYYNNKVYNIETKSAIDYSLFKTGKKSTTHRKSIIRAPLPGIIASVEIKKGDKVKEGQTLIKLIAMKMENDIVAETSGTVKEIRVKKNDTVNKGDILVILE